MSFPPLRPHRSPETTRDHQSWSASSCFAHVHKEQDTSNPESSYPEAGLFGELCHDPMQTPTPCTSKGNGRGSVVDGTRLVDCTDQTVGTVAALGQHDNAHTIPPLPTLGDESFSIDPADDRPGRSRRPRAPNPLRKWSPSRLRKLCRSARPRNLPKDVDYDQVNDVQDVPISLLVDGYDLNLTSEHISDAGPIHMNVAIGERLPIFDTDADLADLQYETAYRVFAIDGDGQVLVDMHWSFIVPD